MVKRDLPNSARSVKKVFQKDLSSRFDVGGMQWELRPCHQRDDILAVPLRIYILISMSTPAGKLRLIRASIVRSVGLTMSIKRL